MTHERIHSRDGVHRVPATGNNSLEQRRDAVPGIVHGVHNGFGIHEQRHDPPRALAGTTTLLPRNPTLLQPKPAASTKHRQRGAATPRQPLPVRVPRRDDRIRPGAEKKGDKLRTAQPRRALKRGLPRPLRASPDAEERVLSTHPRVLPGAQQPHHSATHRRAEPRRERHRKMERSGNPAVRTLREIAPGRHTRLIVDEHGSPPTAGHERALHVAERIGETGQGLHDRAALTAADEQALPQQPAQLIAHGLLTTAHSPAHELLVDAGPVLHLLHAELRRCRGGGRNSVAAVAVVVVVVAGLGGGRSRSGGGRSRSGGGRSRSGGGPLLAVEHRVPERGGGLLRGLHVGLGCPDLLRGLGLSCGLGRTRAGHADAISEVVKLVEQRRLAGTIYTPAPHMRTADADRRRHRPEEHPVTLKRHHMFARSKIAGHSSVDPVCADLRLRNMNVPDRRWPDPAVEYLPCAGIVRQPRRHCIIKGLLIHPKLHRERGVSTPPSSSPSRIALQTLQAQPFAVHRIVQTRNLFFENIHKVLRRTGRRSSRGRRSSHPRERRPPLAAVRIHRHRHGNALRARARGARALHRLRDLTLPPPLLGAPTDTDLAGSV